jgi:methyl-accepting chemotaxis protein
MKWFLDKSIASKLLITFSVVLLLSTFLGVFSILKLAAVQDATTDLAGNVLGGTRAIGDLSSAIATYRRWEMRMVITIGDNTDQKVAVDGLRATLERFKQVQTEYEPFIDDPEEKRRYEALKSAWAEYLRESQSLQELIRANKQVQATALLQGESFQKFNAASDAAAALEDFQKTSAAEDVEHSTRIYTTGRLWIIIVLCGSFAIGLLMAIWIARTISRPINEVKEVAQRITAGDLTGKEISLSSNDEVGNLARSMNEMQEKLRSLVQSISENAQNVANASEEFSAVSHQISANSEETSAQANAVSASTEQVNRGLQTVASATEEMSASIQEIAKNATEAAKVADGAMKTALETNAIVSKLGTSSAEIGQVIKVITSIAQKTDLLALNATVEAARAGEVGAGFAVVANEVKELAKQTATATEDISRKIETIQADAKSAVTAIASISEVIGHVNDISGTIATAVEQQSATTSEMSRNVSEAAKGSNDVAQNIHGVAQAAQSTSQGATDSQNAAKQLAQMSTQLQELVHRFKVTGNGSSPHASA